MKHLLIAILAVGVGISSLNATAQEMDKKARKQAKKEARAQQQQVNIELTKIAVDSMAFVLEADRLQSKRGTTVNVPSNLNFVAVNGESAFIQIGSNALVGTNGVGGVSVDARVTKFVVDKNEKNGSYTIQMSCMASTGIYDVLIRSNSDGNAASATIGGNWGKKITYQGRLVPLPLSTVYKGSPRY